jgi:6-phosphofructokinase 1
VERLIDEAEAGTDGALAIGLNDGVVGFSALETLRRKVISPLQRPKHQWWMDLRPIAKVLAQPGPSRDQHEPPSPHTRPRDFVSVADG